MQVHAARQWQGSQIEGSKQLKCRRNAEIRRDNTGQQIASFCDKGEHHSEKIQEDGKPASTSLVWVQFSVLHLSM